MGSDAPLQYTALAGLSHSLLCMKCPAAHAVPQKRAGVDAIILDDVARVTRATNKKTSLFNKQLRSPASRQDLLAEASAAAANGAANGIGGAANGGTANGAGGPEMERVSSSAAMSMQVLAITPIGSPM